MTDASLIVNPVFSRALVLGAFGGAGLVLTAIYSRRGPLIFPAYASLLGGVALLLARYGEVAYVERFVAAFAAFSVASAALYVTTGILADRDRRRLVAQGRLPETALAYRTAFLGHAWRVAALAAVGLVVSAGVAFVAA